MNKLKPCPFCGNSEIVSSCCALDYPTTNVRAYVNCECGATIQCDGRVADSKKLLADAMKAWNRRKRK